MSRLKLAILFAFGVTVSSIQIVAQSIQPKAIEFKGAPQYTNAELCAAAGLKPNTTVTAAELNDHMKLLNDSGMFADISFNFDGQNLVFQVTPYAALVPVQFENLPVQISDGLDDQLRKRVALYQGKVPATGTILDGVRTEIQAELAAAGSQAKVEST
jgi:outer membrane protein assembly factor BamA